MDAPKAARQIAHPVVPRIQAFGDQSVDHRDLAASNRKQLRKQQNMLPWVYHRLRCLKNDWLDAQGRRGKTQVVSLLNFDNL